MSLFPSTVHEKFVNAVSGVALFGWVCLHMLGNLKVFQGATAFDGYAEWLRSMGYPVVPSEGVLWGVRAVLVVAVLAHVGTGFHLWAVSRRARSTRYQGPRRFLGFSRSSLTMRWGGVLIATFVIYHLLHLTFGTVHRDFVRGSPFHNVATGFDSAWVLSLYLATLVALGLHLHHGIYSACQTLGLDHPRSRYDRSVRLVALALAVGVPAGFATVPLAAHLGLLSS